jgi:hypothetical protein
MVNPVNSRREAVDGVAVISAHVLWKLLDTQGRQALKSFAAKWYLVPTNQHCQVSGYWEV